MSDIQHQLGWILSQVHEDHRRFVSTAVVEITTEAETPEVDFVEWTGVAFTYGGKTKILAKMADLEKGRDCDQGKICYVHRVAVSLQKYLHVPMITDGPGPYVPPEAEVVAPPPPPPDGVVAFGPPADDGHGSYLMATNNTVPVGTHANKDGIEYVLIQHGRIGTLGYWKMWVPVGSE